MRNYIKELKDRGYTYRELSKQTGVSTSKLSSLARGKVHLKSGTAIYDNIRNASRRASYEFAREGGASPEESTRLRRVLLTGESISRPQTEWVHWHGKRTTRYQTTVVAEFRDPMTGERLFGMGSSKAKRARKDTTIDEAIESAKGSLNNYDLECIRVIETGHTKLIFVGARY